MAVLHRVRFRSIKEQFQAEFLTHTVPCLGLLRWGTAEHLSVWKLAPSRYTERPLPHVCSELWIESAEGPQKDHTPSRTWPLPSLRWP